MDDQKTAVAADTKQQSAEAQELADKLALPLASVTDTTYPLLLVVTGERLELRQTGEGKSGPVYVDFISGKADYRRREGGGRKETIARAVGRKGQFKPVVLDATAGLGRDAFVLACSGCRVTMCEQNPVLAALLEDGFDRAQGNADISEIINKNINLQHGNSLEIMKKCRETTRPDVVYLDPMFPHRTKSALVKKEMQVLQQLLGEDQNGDQLLEQALITATKRVVVKRPSSAPALNETKPDIEYKTKKNRFNVYLVAK